MTADGRDLADAIVPLIRWGARRLGGGGDAMAGLADREAAKGVNETYQYLVDDTAFHFTVDDGSIELHDGPDDGPAHEPTVLVTTDEKTYANLVSGKINASSGASAVR